MKSSSYQLGTAHKLVFTNGVYQEDDHIFHVKSSSEKNKVYIVIYRTDNHEDNYCECLGFKYYPRKKKSDSGHCSHIAACRVFKRSAPKND